jgi:hypothetical protein
VALFHVTDDHVAADQLIESKHRLGRDQEAETLAAVSSQLLMLQIPFTSLPDPMNNTAEESPMAARTRVYSIRS